MIQSYSPGTVGFIPRPRYKMARLALISLVLYNYATTTCAAADQAADAFTRRIDLDYRHVVVSFCNASDKFQQWRVNSTEGIVYLAQPNQCMSLAPNAVDLSFPCDSPEHMSHEPTSPDSNKADQSFRIDSNSGERYRLNHDCFEADREYGNWGLNIYEDFSNVVTRKCHKTRKMAGHTLGTDTLGTSRPFFIFDNTSELGLLVNAQSGKCVQVGGDIKMQCMEMYDTKGLRPGINDYISPSVYPAYLYPCGKGCRPKDVQSWMSTPISTSSTSTSTFSLLRLRNDPRLCLRSGIDSSVAQSWSQSQVGVVFLSAACVLVACLMFEHWRGPRLTREKKNNLSNGANGDIDTSLYLLFSPSLYWMTIRFLLALTGPLMLSCVYTLTLTNIRGGRSYYARTMTVHGMLFCVTALFAHIMLLARRDDDHGGEILGTAVILEEEEMEDGMRPVPVSGTRCVLKVRPLLLIRRRIVDMVIFCSEYPSVMIHSALIFLPRGYDAVVASQASTVSPYFYTFGMPITVSAFWQIARSAANSNVGHNKAYSVQVAWRWLKILLAQWCVLVSTLFGPDGTPGDVSTVSSNILFLGLTAEVVLASRRTFTVQNLFDEKHLLVVIIFCVPLVLLSFYEIVAMTVSNRSTYGSRSMTGLGAIGGDSNQVKGSTAMGWWYGPYARYVAYFQWSCYLVILYCLNFSVQASKWWCNSGIQAPAWLGDVLIETQGRIPALKNGAKYHFFISKKMVLDQDRVKI